MLRCARDKSFSILNCIDDKPEERAKFERGLTTLQQVSDVLKNKHFDQFGDDDLLTIRSICESWGKNIQEILCNGGDGREHPCCTQRYWAENLVCWFLFTYKSQYFPHNIFSYRCIRNPADQLWKYVERYELRNHLDLSIVIPFKRSSGQWIKITTKTGRHGCKPCDSLSCYCVWQSSTSFTIKSRFKFCSPLTSEGKIDTGSKVAFLWPRQRPQ